MKRALSFALALSVALFGGCKKSEEVGAPLAADAAAPATQAGIPPPPPLPPPPPPTAEDGGPARKDVETPAQAGDWLAKELLPRLEKEKSSRPTGTPRAEDVLAAVEKAGVALVGRNQALASILGASYCMGADTTSALGLMVCEYPTEAAAHKGREQMLSFFGQGLPMQVLVNKKTTLSMTNLTRAPRAEQERATVSRVFQGL
jgi:hypothetical protein